MILAGSGRVKLDEEIADVRMLDTLRIAPAVVRAFEAGPDGLEFLGAGLEEGRRWPLFASLASLAFATS